VEETRRSADGARAEFLHSQAEMSRHARRNHWVTASGIVVAGGLSLVSILFSWSGLHATPRQAPATASYQQHMESLTAHQTEAIQAQTAALDRLSKALIDTQRKAAVAEQKVVAAAVAPLLVRAGGNP
jgi:outer membrane receptor for monomeric catechols